MNKPLLTFVLFAYKQEQFIREAIQGALSQTYSPLQIIFSDDCSPDTTFEIMRAAAESYRGPHQILLNRNPKNVGLIGHLNRVVDLASGDLIVVAAGDDISLPERTTLSYEAWEASDRKATSIHGRFIVIDKNGQSTGAESRITWPAAKELHVRQSVSPNDFIRTLTPSVQGSCHTFSKRLLSEFGPLPAYLNYEDYALAFRSVLLGEIAYINQPLVKYRRHGENTYSPLEIRNVRNAESLRAYHEQIARECGRFVRLYDCFESDVRTLSNAGNLNPQSASELQREIVKARKPYETKLGLYDQRFGRRLLSFLRIAISGGEIRYALGRLIPQSLYDRIFMARRKLRRQRLAS